MDLEAIRRVFQLASFFLLYPDQKWWTSLDWVRKEVNDLQEWPEVFSSFNQFLDRFAQVEQDEWCARYVQTFDFGRSTNLYVTYARFGEQQERGSVLLKMKQKYRLVGLEPTENELSDYLPLMLEFASAVDVDTISDVFGEHVETIRFIRDELDQMKSPYVHVLDASIAALEAVGVSSTDRKGEGCK